jgi:hypothetical protein
MIEQLFGSKTRVKLLQLFYSNPNRSFYVREITRKIDEQINSVRRELSNLLNIGIIESDNNNNKLYYEVNQKYDFFEPLSAIFGGDKAQVAANPLPDVDLKDDLKAIGRVDLALYTGQFTRDESSGIDALFVGDINNHALQKFVTDLEAREGKEIRYTVMSLEDFKYRQQIKDRFINNVIDAKKQILVDSHNLVSKS